MPRTVAASAVIIQFPKAAPRRLLFSKKERQALLALAYAVPGAGVDIAADDKGNEHCSLGAANFEEGAWWTVFVTAAGFDVVNFAGYRVARFVAIEPLVERMGPHIAHMLGLATPSGDAAEESGQATGPRFLTVV